jgi:hypothetical protein
MVIPVPEKLNALWKGKNIRPYSIKASPTQSCIISEPNLRFVTRELDLSGRSISGAESNLCKFHFVITGASPDLTLSSLQEKAKGGRLVKRDLSLQLSVESLGMAVQLLWSSMHSSLKQVAPLNEGFEPDEAVLLLGLSVSKTIGVSAEIQKLESNKRLEFIQKALGLLFREDSTGRLTIVPEAPMGAFEIPPSTREARDVSIHF